MDDATCAGVATQLTLAALSDDTHQYGALTDLLRACRAARDNSHAGMDYMRVPF